MKKKSVRLPAFLLALLCSLFIIPTAFADMGPKASLNITVLNAPEGEVYVDLLHQVSSNPNNRSEEEGYDPVILTQLHSLEGNGWILAVTTGTGGAPIFGDLRPGSQGIYTFGYFGLPETFRIAAATASGAQATAESYTRTRFVTNLVYDWETNTLRESTPTAVIFLCQLAATLIPTLIIEAVILLLFQFRSKRTWLLFLLINVVTQIGLHICCYQLVAQAMQFWFYYFLSLFLPEVVILVVECIACGALFREYSRARRIVFAVCANLASFILGALPLELLSQLINKL